MWAHRVPPSFLSWVSSHPNPMMTVEESPRWIKYRFRDVLHMWLVVGILPGLCLPRTPPREATSRQSFLPVLSSTTTVNSQNKELTFIRLSQHGADADSLQQTLLHFNFIIYSNPYHACWISREEPYLCLWLRVAGVRGTTTLVCWTSRLGLSCKWVGDMAQLPKINSTNWWSTSKQQLMQIFSEWFVLFWYF